jgi:hypothetical protein
VYKAVDTAIGEILAEVDDDTIVVFLASHRMAHNIGAERLLPKILLGCMRPSPSPPGGTEPPVPPCPGSESGSPNGRNGS